MKTLLLLLITLCLLTACDNSKSYYSHVIVTYDSSQFRVINDTIAIRKKSNTYYERISLLGGEYRWYKRE
jgi:hypothetical protein